MMTSLVAEDSMDGVSVREEVGVLQLKTTRTNKSISGNRDLIIAKPTIQFKRTILSQ